MKTIKIQYRYFWSNFGNIVPLIEYYLYKNNLKIEKTNSDPELIIYSVFGKNDDYHNIDTEKINILYTRENLNRFPLVNKYINKFDFVLGFQDCKNGIRIPYYYTMLSPWKKSKEYDIIKNNTDIYKKEKIISLVSRNRHELRIKLLDGFNKRGITVDCPGSVGNNHPKIKNKIGFLQQYYFNICPENSIGINYCTEKLYDALISGCIPIYWGACDIDLDFYNKKKILRINQDKSNIDEVVEKTIDLINNKQSLNDHICMPSFTPYAIDTISNIELKIENFFHNMAYFIKHSS